MRIDVRLLCRGASMVGTAAAVLSVLALVALGLGPHTGRYRVATVLSGSMRPTFSEGAVVVVTPLPATRLRTGDVLMYRIPVDDRRVVAHRVVEILEEGPRPVVRTKGDANDVPDGWVARLDGGTLWRVRGTVPYVGYVVHAMRHPQLRLVAVLVVPAVLTILRLREIWAPRSQRGPAPEHTPAET